MISTQQSPPISPKSAPISPLKSRDVFPLDKDTTRKEEKRQQRPWKQTQQHHHQRSHTVKYQHRKKEADEIKNITSQISLISGPTNFKKANPEELYRQLINGKNF